jgi:PAS domain S-box-containing protein
MCSSVDEMLCNESLTLEELVYQCEALFEMSNQMLAISNKERHLRVNNMWIKNFGWSEEELLNKPWIKFVHPDDTNSAILNIKLMNGRPVLEYKNRIIDKNGKYHMVQWFATPWRNNGTCFSIAKICEEENYL